MNSISTEHKPTKRKAKNNHEPLKPTKRGQPHRSRDPKQTHLIHITLLRTHQSKAITLHSNSNQTASPSFYLHHCLHPRHHPLRAPFASSPPPPATCGRAQELRGPVRARQALRRLRPPTGRGSNRGGR